ncbi:MAG: DNA-processing protein DprA [Anaerolineae bacterium]
MLADDDALARWVALSLIPNLGGRTIARLLEHFGSLDAALNASADDLQRVSGIGPKLAAAIRAVNVAATRQALMRWQTDGVRVLLWHTPDYPPALNDLLDAPPVLFCRGTLHKEDRRAVALVGTRHPTAQGSHAAATLAAICAEHGWTVVSGLAHGIDTIAHQAALEAGGRTVAVLGSGVCAVYPPGNRALAGQIVRRGALLSETHPDASPAAPTLVARNRLISGLSRAVIVVEAGADSGSLHAVRFARTQGRAVFAVIGGAQGNARVLAEGAQPLEMRGGGLKALEQILLVEG